MTIKNFEAQGQVDKQLANVSSKHEELADGFNKKLGGFEELVAELRVKAEQKKKDFEEQESKKDGELAAMKELIEGKAKE